MVYVCMCVCSRQPARRHTLREVCRARRQTSLTTVAQKLHVAKNNPQNGQQPCSFSTHARTLHATLRADNKVSIFGTQCRLYWIKFVSKPCAVRPTSISVIVLGRDSRDRRHTTERSPQASTVRCPSRCAYPHTVRGTSLSLSLDRRLSRRPSCEGRAGVTTPIRRLLPSPAI